MNVNYQTMNVSDLKNSRASIADFIAKPYSLEKWELAKLLLYSLLGIDSKTQFREALSNHQSPVLNKYKRQLHQANGYVLGTIKLLKCRITKPVCTWNLDGLYFARLVAQIDGELNGHNSNGSVFIETAVLDPQYNLAQSLKKIEAKLHELNLSRKVRLFQLLVVSLSLVAALNIILIMYWVQCLHE